MSKELSPLEAWERANNNAYEHGYEISGDLCYIIETALKRLEELEKAFIALSKDDEKAKKLLSLEIEKNRAFEIIKNICKLKVYKNKLGQCFLEGTNILFPISQETYDLLNGVLL